jgi:hypothetical protein
MTTTFTIVVDQDGHAVLLKRSPHRCEGRSSSSRGEKAPDKAKLYYSKQLKKRPKQRLKRAPVPSGSDANWKWWVTAALEPATAHHQGFHGNEWIALELKCGWRFRAI